MFLVPAFWEKCFARWSTDHRSPLRSNAIEVVSKLFGCLSTFSWPRGLNLKDRAGSGRGVLCVFFLFSFFFPAFNMSLIATVFFVIFVAVRDSSSRENRDDEMRSWDKSYVINTWYTYLSLNFFVNCRLRRDFISYSSRDPLTGKRSSCFPESNSHDELSKAGRPTCSFVPLVAFNERVVCQKSWIS